MPTSSPFSPSSRTTGNSTCESPTVSGSSECVNVGPVNSGMITPAREDEERGDRAERRSA